MTKHHTEDVEKEVEEQEEIVENAEVAELKQQAEDYKNKFLRALADYTNLEKRMFSQQMEIGQVAQMHVILKLLPFLDNLEKAEVFIKDPGLKMIKDQFNQTVKEMGVEEIEVMGKEFDPHVAEAIDIVEGEKDDIVMEVFEKGWKLGSKVLRPAKVKVSKKANQN